MSYEGYMERLGSKPHSPDEMGDLRRRIAELEAESWHQTIDFRGKHAEIPDMNGGEFRVIHLDETIAQAAVRTIRELRAEVEALENPKGHANTDLDPYEAALRTEEPPAEGVEREHEALPEGTATVQPYSILEGKPGYPNKGEASTDAVEKSSVALGTSAGTTPSSPTLLPCAICEEGLAVEFRSCGCGNESCPSDCYECQRCGLRYTAKGWNWLQESLARGWNTRAEPAPEETWAGGELLHSEGVECNHDWIALSDAPEKARCAKCKVRMEDAETATHEEERGSYVPGPHRSREGAEGVWRCSCCGETYEAMDGHWRWAGDHPQHKCPENDGNAGHFDARFFPAPPAEPGDAKAFDPERSPGHTALMVTPESLEDYGPDSEAQRLYDMALDAPPLPEEEIERIVQKVCRPEDAEDFPEGEWMEWWTGNATGALAIGPITKHNQESARWAWERRGEEVADLKHAIVGLQWAEAHQARRATASHLGWDEVGL